MSKKGKASPDGALFKSRHKWQRPLVYVSPRTKLIDLGMLKRLDRRPRQYKISCVNSFDRSQIGITYIVRRSLKHIPYRGIVLYTTRHYNVVMYQCISYTPVPEPKVNDIIRSVHHCSAKSMLSSIPTPPLPPTGLGVMVQSVEFAFSRGGIGTPLRL